MDAKLTSDWGTAETDRSIIEAFRRESGRLGGFIRRRVPDSADAEDLLQEVFSELVEAARRPEPIEQVGAWLFRVARNRITDLFRSRSRAGSRCWACLRSAWLAQRRCCCGTHCCGGRGSPPMPEARV